MTEQPPQPSVTTHIGGLIADADPEAVRFLWSRYFPRMVELARAHLRGLSRAPADEEDVALMAFQKFYQAATSGRIPDLNDREDLWHSLMVFTFGKAVEQRRHEGRSKRDGGTLVAGGDSLNDLMSDEPDPAVAAILAEEYRGRLEALGDDQLMEVAVKKMGGWTHKEISASIGLSERTVRRQVALVRKIWEADSDGDS